MLYPTVLRQILLGVAGAGLFEPLWSPRILEEWARATIKLGPGAEEIARAEIAAMTAEWPRASVRPRDGDLARLHLPDPDDVHVLAAAIAGSADILLTVNARDFPRHTLSEEGLERRDPDQLLVALFQDDATAVRRAVRAVHANAQRLSGEALGLKPLLKRVRLPRLAKAMEA